MKSRRMQLGALLLAAPLFGGQYQTASPDYHYKFPRDHFNHPGYQTEWWYYTGNLKSGDGHRFGFELTFFRQAVDREPKATRWAVRDLFLAHLALSDLDGHRFYHTERTNREGPGLAGASEIEGRIWNGNWQIKLRGEDQSLQAIASDFELHFTLHSEKPPVIHGENGVSQKAAGPGRASHYISLTRLAATGQIALSGKTFQVTGLAWMDHEFFTHQLEENQVGWDWLSLQLDDKTEVMLFRIRRKNGSIDPYSAGTFVDAQGKSTHLGVADFVFAPMSDTWTSLATHATYPIRWKIAIPKLNIEMDAATPLPSQELASSTKFAPSYWEGAIAVRGHKGPSPLSGVGYLEMTGYDRLFEIMGDGRK